MRRRTFVAALACLVVGPHEPIAGRKTYAFALKSRSWEDIVAYYYDFRRWQLPMTAMAARLTDFDRTIVVSRSA